jgi:anti-anti-sigma factor
MERELAMIPDVLVLPAGHGRVVVELNAEHDLATKDALRDLFTRLVEENSLVVIDLTGAEFIDSSVIHVLAQADRLARVRGSNVRVQLGMEGIARRALEITGMVDQLNCVVDRNEALAA